MWRGVRLYDLLDESRTLSTERLFQYGSKLWRRIMWLEIAWNDADAAILYLL